MIRNALIEDLKDIVDIYNSTIPGRMVTADTEPVSVEDRIPWYNQHNSKTRPLWVMEVDGEIAGWLSFQSFYGRPAYNGTVEISIYISEKFRGRGMGEEFLNYAIDNAYKYGVNVFMAFIFGHNEPSLRLFKKNDFEQWGNYPKIAEMDGIKRDLIILGRYV